MAEPVLDQPRVVAGISQGVAASVAQHVGVDPKRQLGAKRGVEWLDLKSHGGGGLPRLPHCDLSGVRIDRIYEHSNTNGLGHHVMQEPQPLSRSLRYVKIDAGRVAAGASEAGYKAKLDRVYTFAEDDWDRCRCSFHRERYKRGAYRGDHGHLAVDQVGYQCRQTIVWALKPMVLDRYILAFDVTSFVQAFAERRHIA